MGQWKQKIFLVSQLNLQIKLFTDYLSNAFDCPVIVSSSKSATFSKANHNDLVLLDAEHMSLESMQSWHPDIDTTHNFTLAAFNVQDELHGYTLVTGVKLQGIFYKNYDLELFCKGVGILQTGQFWMSRSLMSQVVETYHRHQCNAYRSTCGLTQRELQILGLLSAGATNKEIAEHLFVSLHTIKSHLYKTFKKIEVRNRTEAVNWSLQHLGTPPPLELIAKRRASNKEILS